MSNAPPLHRKYKGMAVHEGVYAREHMCIGNKYALIDRI